VRPANVCRVSSRTDGVISYLSPQEKNKLAWIKTWARNRITAEKHGRKHRPREPVMPQHDVEMLSALFEIEDAARKLLGPP